MRISLFEHESGFSAYTESFITKDSSMADQYRLKVLHTANVLSHARTLSAGEFHLRRRKVSRALFLAALYHDIGRFQQLKQYRTFADALSCNHGRSGLVQLRKLGFLAGEDREVQRLVFIGVSLHNRFAVPVGVAGEARDVLLAVRDADKLDILRIMAEQTGKGRKPDPTVVMHLKDEPEKYSPVMLDNLGAKGGLSFADMRYVNDFRLLLCHWAGELVFPTARAVLRRENHLFSIIEGMEGLPEVQEKARAYVMDVLNA